MNFMNKTNPIGFFDSGIGGLTVVKAVTRLMPNENIVYFGDTARVPYGSKSNDTVVEYSIQAANFLLRKNIKLLVVACNTASSVALNELRKFLTVPVIGMIEPGAKMALSESKNKRIGVIGTRATINNKAYAHELKRLNPKAKVFEEACPLFVPLAEEGWLDHKATELIAKTYLSEMKENKIDSLILGCTHYPILADIIQKVVGKSVKLVDSGTPAARLVEDYLNGRGLRNQSVHHGQSEFYVSDVPTKFREIAEIFLGKKITHLHKVELEELTNE
ncbi:MAG: glutamate racemase [Ignavibacteriales bacterium]|nr:MAG: glutamate racemase [Stygiobacter sp.]MBI3123986.1 glutamate racemase [Ignavibacteriales bacterium]RJQ65239.1 MAG: glutamate racemase [Stygiobacter sp.]